MVKRGRIKRRETAFTRQLTAWMVLAGLDDEALAKAVGVSIMAVSRWRNNVNTPTIEKWGLIADALDVERDEIAKLLIGVQLLPPRVQEVAEDIARLPARRQREAVTAIHELLDRLDVQVGEREGGAEPGGAT